MEPAENSWQGAVRPSVLQKCGGAAKPLGRGGTGSEPGDMMTKTTAGDSQLWQLIPNTQGPEAAASAPRVLLEKEGARPGSDYAGSESPHQFQKESLGKGLGRSWERSGGSQSLICQCHCPYHLGMEGQQTYHHCWG